MTAFVFIFTDKFHLSNWGCAFNRINIRKVLLSYTLHYWEILFIFNFLALAEVWRHFWKQHGYIFTTQIVFYIQFSNALRYRKDFKFCDPWLILMPISSYGAGGHRANMKWQKEMDWWLQRRAVDQWNSEEATKPPYFMR